MLAKKTTCTVIGNKFNDGVSSFHAKLTLGKNLILDSIVKDSSWEGDASGGLVDLYTDINKTETITFFKFVLKSNAISNEIDTLVKLEDIKIGDSKFIETNFQSSSLDINVVANTNNDPSQENDNNDNNDNSKNDNLIDNNQNNNDDHPDSENSSTNDVVSNHNTGNNILYVVIGLITGVILLLIIIVKKIGVRK